MTRNYLRRVGTARPSHLMYTAGVGALIDLPNFSVLVKGLEHWSHTGLTDYVVDEPRLRSAVNRALQLYGGAQITELRKAPWAEGADASPQDASAQNIGVPVTPFPQWLRCTACDLLASIDSDAFAFVNSNPRTPHEAKFVHPDCPRARKPLAVAARFTLVCAAGHLDEFPYAHFVHGGTNCAKVPRPTLRMTDHGGNQAANVTIECVNCRTKRNIREAMGESKRVNLPACRGRHPHLGMYADCDREATLMVAGASNQWFPMTLSALALPPDTRARVDDLVEERWHELQHVTSRAAYDLMAQLPHYAYLNEFDADAVVAAVARRHGAGDSDGDGDGHLAAQADLLGPEWAVLASPQPPAPTDDFALAEVAVPDHLTGLFSDVRQVERLREARALYGFTRLDAPDPESPELATPVRLYRSSPGWVPASEVRGEGIFLQVRPDLMAEWEGRATASTPMRLHREAFGRFRGNRKSDRHSGEFDIMAGWPGERYIALHTLSHLLIRTIALECGYSSAGLGERIYAGTPDDPRTGILIYTAVPDAEGTLGGLVTLADPANFARIVRRALHDAARCSGDPLCAERLPKDPSDQLHGAACHSCLFVSETTCERGNRFLDRRFLVSLGDGADHVLTPKELWP